VSSRLAADVEEEALAIARAAARDAARLFVRVLEDDALLKRIAQSGLLIANGLSEAAKCSRATTVGP
jgi:hypothetical protein